MYQAEKHISECLHSISLNTERDEIIIVDDGSTDASLSIAKDVLSNYPDENILWIQQENKGLGNARNQGILAAKGKYCVLLDADDSFLPEKLDKLETFLNANPNTKALYHKLGVMDSQFSLPSYAVKQADDILLKHNPITPSGFIGLTELLKTQPFSEDPELHGAEDLHLWYRLLKSGIKFSFINSTLGKYRVDGGMSKDHEVHYNKVAHALADLKSNDNLEEATYQKATIRKRYETARAFHKEGNFKQAKKFYPKQVLSFKKSLLNLSNALKIKL